MNRIALLAAGCAALALAACDHPDAARQRKAAELKVVTKLDCPETQGQLTRKEVAADGKSCLYTSADGAEVKLTIVPLNGGKPAAALAPIDAELSALIPPGKVPAAEGDAQADSETKVVADANGVAVSAKGDRGSNEDVEINLPGVHIKTEGENATVKVAGGVDINASEDGRAEIRANRNVTETTDSKDPRKNAISARYILTNDDHGGEYRVVGYEARGPKGGPLVVGTVKIKREGGADSDELFDDISDLIRHNVGGKKHGSHIIVD